MHGAVRRALLPPTHTMTVSNTVPTEFTLNNGVKIPVVGLGE